MKNGLTLLLFVGSIIGFSSSMTAQEKNGLPIETGGYVKYLGSLFHFDLLGTSDTYTGHLIHHRLNADIALSTGLSFNIGWRNQLYFGELVERSPGFAVGLRSQQNDFLNLSWNPINETSYFLNSTLDRLYLEWYHGDWEVSAGRQRVNWGISNIWNPNDIFNAYSFIDFDYEERPGSDALLVKYYLSATSSIEFSARVWDETSRWILGALYKFNKNQYDYQLLAGLFRDHFVLGGGWAGAIVNTGFKGEWSWFTSTTEPDNFIATLGLDHVYPGGTYLSFGYLYNHLGALDASVIDLFTFQISAKNIYPYRHALLFQNTFQISPLTNAGYTAVYSPSVGHQVFFGPLFSYSLKNNLDLNFVAQIGLDNSDGFRSPFQSYYLRLKWSY